MAEDNTLSFVTEQFRRLNVRFDKFEERMDKIELRLGNVERRLTALTHFEQSVLAHLASVHNSIDNLRADLTGMDKRVIGLEAR
ncbi:MAG TPA: hypothetical protein VF638_01220 [Sphingomonas sp.]|jgi:predicted  nucleic acid-binding Zn-ribbon protein